MIFKDYDYQKYKNGGVYKIINLLNNRIYIGSTNCFDKRSKAHKYSLDNNKHKNKFLQSDYLKSGGENFIFEIIEFVDKEKKSLLFLAEQKYIDKFYDNQLNCYNLDSSAKCSRLNCGNSKTKNYFKHKEETIEKIKISLKSTWKNNQDLKEIAIKNGINKWKDYSADIIVSNIKTGEILKINGSVRKFCLDRNLSYKSFNQMLNGRTKYSNGWFLGEDKPIDKRKYTNRKPLSEEHKEKISRNKYKGYVITNKNGDKIILNKNVKKHASELKINYKSLLRVLKGELKETSGWSLFIEQS